MVLVGVLGCGGGGSARLVVMIWCGTHVRSGASHLGWAPFSCRRQRDTGEVDLQMLEDVGTEGLRAVEHEVVRLTEWLGGT